MHREKFQNIIKNKNIFFLPTCIVKNFHNPIKNKYTHIEKQIVFV